MDRPYRCAGVLIYGHTAFFGMDDLLPPILKRNPIWPSTFPKILSVVGVIAAITVLLNIENRPRSAMTWIFPNGGNTGCSMRLPLLAAWLSTR